MNILKRRVSLILSIIMLALAVIPLTMTSASSNTDDVEMSVKLNGSTEMQYAYEYEVKAGDKITVSARSTNGSSIAFIGYYYYDEGIETVKDTAASNITITIPSEPVGTERCIAIEAVASNNQGVDDPTNRTGWQFYYLKWVADEPEVELDVNVRHNGKTLADRSTTSANQGDSLNLSATPSNRVKRLFYLWDDGEIQEVASANATIKIPSFEAGSTHYLYVLARDIDDADTEQKIYKFVMPEENEPITPVVSMDVNVKYNGKTLADRSTTNAAQGESLNLVATTAERVKRIYYLWDDGEIQELASANATITIPSTFANGTEHFLYVLVRDTDDVDTEQKIYKFVMPETVKEDDLDVLPWEEDNDDLEGLAISLRNDSESEKANKNLYSLNEDVTYFVDFRNAGKDITDEVVIKLELPLEFEVIDSANGVVDADKGTITWTYPNGMEEDYEGTKTVVVRYTAFDRNSTDSKVIYPLATISKKAKLVDDSAVVNFVYRDEDTVIEDGHEPYMYGDANATTFRPDATITRAEGALVLTRILLGQDAIDNVKVTSVYPDLDQTYLEAQKAIIAATTYGIINGYTDGYYRPNQTMTRAEFMKIIAKFVELHADDEGIDGLQIKEIEELVKMYDDPKNKYAVNGQLISEHWAIEEVSLLARLNMTSVSSDEKDLRMDAGITRAEVAQLVNFYLLRAPAEVNNRTKTQFSDVNKKHDLFADIVEATREAHDYTITEDGTEIAE